MRQLIEVQPGIIKKSPLPLTSNEGNFFRREKLPAVEENVRKARELLTDAITIYVKNGPQRNNAFPLGAGILHRMDDIRIVGSELVTNAINHTATPEIGIDLGVIARQDAQEGDLLLVVWDGMSGWKIKTPRPQDNIPKKAPYEGPVIDEISELSENFRGFPLVGALSDNRGWYPKENGSPGKNVWVVFHSPAT